MRCKAIGVQRAQNELHAREVDVLMQKTKSFTSKNFGLTKVDAKSILIRRLIKAPSGTNKTRSLNSANDTKIYVLECELIPIDGCSVFIRMDKKNPQDPKYSVFLCADLHSQVKSIEISFKLSLYQNNKILDEITTKFLYQKNRTGTGLNIRNTEYNPKLDLSVFVEISKYEVTL